MKKIFILIILFLCICLTGCTGSSNEPKFKINENSLDMKSIEILKNVKDKLKSLR